MSAVTKHMIGSLRLPVQYFDARTGTWKRSMIHAQGYATREFAENVAVEFGLTDYLIRPVQIWRSRAPEVKREPWEGQYDWENPEEP